MGKWTHFRGQYPERVVALVEKKGTYEEQSTEDLEYKVSFLDKNRKDLERLKTENQLELDAAMEVLLKRWEDQGDTQQVKREALGMLSRVDDIYCRISDLDEFKKWAMSNNMQSIVKETVNVSSLTSAVKDLLVDGNPIPEGVAIFTKSRIRASQPKEKA
jgi:hypothetical protein